MWTLHSFFFGSVLSFCSVQGTGFKRDSIRLRARAAAKIQVEEQSCPWSIGLALAILLYHMLLGTFCRTVNTPSFASINRVVGWLRSFNSTSCTCPTRHRPSEEDSAFLLPLDHHSISSVPSSLDTLGRSINRSILAQRVCTEPCSKFLV